MVDTERQSRRFGLRLNGITAAFEERPMDNRCFLVTLTNTRSTALNAVIVSQDGHEARFPLRPFQKTLFYPQVAVAREPSAILGAFDVEPSQPAEVGSAPRPEAESRRRE